MMMAMMMMRMIMMTMVMIGGGPDDDVYAVGQRKMFLVQHLVYELQIWVFVYGCVFF